MAIKTAKELAIACESVAKNYKTLYVLGCFGAPMNAKNKLRYCNKNNEKRVDKIRNASADTFGFDCVCLIKGLLWGWSGKTSHVYGGAAYCSNGVPDIGADQMITKCSGVSTNFSDVQIGELLWKKGHVGIYIGNGLAVESTPSWDNCVQITAVGNIGKKSGYNTRTWTKHGKLPYVDYTQGSEPAPAAIEIGDIVNFAGTKHYTSANALVAKSCGKGLAKVTAIHKLGKSKHPYHLVRTGKTGPYGWVNAADIIGAAVFQGTVKVNTSLNIRTGPSTGYSRIGSLKNGEKITIIEENNGWGKLEQGGWVSLDYIVKA